MTKGNLKSWEGEDSLWLQDTKGMKFHLARLHKKEISKDSFILKIPELFLGARIHKGKGEKLVCSQGVYPPEFEFCPLCGAALSPLSVSQNWIPPFGNGSGLRLSHKKKSTFFSTSNQGRPFPLPASRGDFQFLVGELGACIPALIGFNKLNGKVSVFNPANMEWLVLQETRACFFGENRQPEWSWSAAVLSGGSERGFAVPTPSGPVWITIDWMKGAVSPIAGSGACIGGVGALNDKVYAPVQQEKELQIQCFDTGIQEWKTVGHVPVSWRPENETDNFFSVPIIDNDRQTLFWVGTQGLLQFRPALIPEQDSGAEVSWRPWETDPFPCRALPELGPPFRDRLGYYWQLCFDDHEEGYRYYKLTGDEGDVFHVDGGRFSSGLASFSRHYDYYAEPWEPRDELREERADRFRIPLLCLDTHSNVNLIACFGCGTTDPILKVIRNNKQKLFTSFRIESPNEPPLDLHMEQALNCFRPWEVRVFVYQEELIVYSPQEGLCWAWELW